MTPKSLIRNITWRLSRIFLSNEQHSWNKAKALNAQFKKGVIIPIDEYTSTVPVKQFDGKRVVCIYDGKIKNGGLADRLRGIVSVYEVCKELGIEFKLIFTSPFKLQQFLEPNNVDWRIAEQELNYSTKITDICYIFNNNG